MTVFAIFSANWVSVFSVINFVLGSRFAGRVEAVSEAKTGRLIVKNIWYEEGVRRTKKLEIAVNGCLKRLGKLNQCREVVVLDGSAPV